MIIFDDELIKFRHIQNQYLFTRSTVIKDYVRVNGVVDIVALLFQIIQSHKFLDQRLVKSSLKVIARLIDWNLLNIFTECVNYINENLMNSNSSFLGESLDVINSIIHKGMEAPQKVEVIKYLNVNQVLDSILRPVNSSSASENGNIITNKKIDENVFFKICEIVANLGSFANESYGAFKNIIFNINVTEITDEQQAFFGFINELANYAIYHSISIFNIARKFDLKSIYQICDFLGELISFLKTNDFIIEMLVS